MKIVTRCGVLVLLLMAATQAAAADKVLSQELEESVTRLIEEELRETRAPGAAVAIVRDGEVVYLRHANLVKFSVTWDGKRLVLKTDKEQPLERTGPDTFRTEDQQGLAFVVKPGQPRAKYLHMDLLSAIRSGK